MTSTPDPCLKRVYDDPDPSDGRRILVDRLWPRGLTKERAAVDLWLKDVAPSPELRTRWHHDPDHFDEYAALYVAELEGNPAVETLRAEVAAHPATTLLYGARDPQANHAVVLRQFLTRGS